MPLPVCRLPVTPVCRLATVGRLLYPLFADYPLLADLPLFADYPLLAGYYLFADYPLFAGYYLFAD